MMTTTIETTLLVVKEVLIYKIPPRQTSRGYRASEWDSTQFMWSGRLRVVEQGDRCTIKLEEKESGQLFAQCPYDASGSSVEQVTDSSRYFVLKIQDVASGRHAFVGLGFTDRNEAFDFNVALQDHQKHLALKNSTATQQSLQNNQPKIDFSLKEGATLSVNIGGLFKKSRSQESTAASVSVTGTGNAADNLFTLPPPPSASFTSKQANNSSGSNWVQF